MNNWLAKFFYKFKVLRRPFKYFVKNKIIRQIFFNGSIYFNVVEFPFYWLNDATCEKIDRDIQDKLLELSLNSEYFIDIGANVGLMTLSVALRNKNIKVVAYDPNKAVLKYLNRSVKKNKLTDRVKVVNAAVSNKAGISLMDFSKGPYSGHFSNKGVEVEVIDFEDLLNEYGDKKMLFKMDIEGFELLLVPVIIQHKNPKHMFVIEMHPKGLNNISDPKAALELLFQNNYTLKNVFGKKLTSANEIIDWENVTCCYEV